MILKVYFLTTLTNFIELTWLYSGLVAPNLPLMYAFTAFANTINASGFS
jgi:hypothetical protein